MDRGRGGGVGRPAVGLIDTPAAGLVVEPRRVLLGDREIDFRLRRSQRRRRIVLTVDGNGLTVNVPWRTSEQNLTKVLTEASAWVLRKLDALPTERPGPRRWGEGERLDFLGHGLTLRLAPASGFNLVRLLDAEVLQVELQEEAGEADAVRVRAAVVRWYRRHASEHFGRRVELYCAKLGLALPRLFLSDARARWGSCNSRREVRLNWRLVQAAPPLIDYVVAHEIAHLIELNHSRRFWALVEQLCPSYPDARTELNRLSQHLLSI